jgi:hypothetical protein
MRTLAARRNRNLIILAALSLLLPAFCVVVSTALRDAARFSGWLLFGLIVFLAGYNLRKKLAFLPVGSSASWLQLHIYVGLLTAVVFGIHVRWHVPNGIFESLLSLLYASVFLSGIVGLFVSRSFAKRLTTRGSEVLFERIPVYRKRLATEVESLVLDCLDETESTAIAQFYADRLRPFFAATRNFWHHLRQSSRPRFALVSELQSYNRYLNDSEREVMKEILARVESKDDLDYQYALQATLKYWLFVHVPLTYALLVFAVFHLLLVSSFSGGAL